MVSLLARLRDDLFGDDLFPRVISFMFGLIIGSIVLGAVVSGVARESKDGAFFILLCLMAVLAFAALYGALRGDKKLLDHMGVWVGGEIMLILGLVTLAAPITIAIKRLRKHESVT